MVVVKAVAKIKLSCFFPLSDLKKESAKTQLDLPGWGLENNIHINGKKSHNLWHKRQALCVEGTFYLFYFEHQVNNGGAPMNEIF